MSTPTPVEPARAPSGWYVLLGLALGAVATPLAVLAGFTLWNLYDPMCSGGGGAEDSLSCALRTVAVMVVSLPFGAVIGLIVTLRVARRRMVRTTVWGAECPSVPPENQKPGAMAGLLLLLSLAAALRAARPSKRTASTSANALPILSWR